MHIRALALGVLFITSQSAHAQALDEIVVTGQRVSDTSWYVPVVHLRKKADFMIVPAGIESDSRQQKLRQSEVRKTLEALERQARGVSSIQLGILKTFELEDDEIEYIDPFDIDKVEYSTGFRSDTTRVSFIIKTPILAGDEAPEAVLERIEDFIDSIPVTGRATVTGNSDPGLSIVNISQYRTPLLTKLAKDNAHLKEIFGENFGISIAGLEQPLQWQLAGPMEIAIYFPYTSTATANRSR